MEIGNGQGKLSASAQKMAGLIDPNQMMMSSKMPMGGTNQ
jgi:dynein heavy chain, axonemal